MDGATPAGATIRIRTPSGAGVTLRHSGGRLPKGAKVIGPAPVRNRILKGKAIDKAVGNFGDLLGKGGGGGRVGRF